jgi:hypothetical protein
MLETALTGLNTENYKGFNANFDDSFKLKLIEQKHKDFFINDYFS